MRIPLFEQLVVWSLDHQIRLKTLITAVRNSRFFHLEETFVDGTSQPTTATHNAKPTCITGDSQSISRSIHPCTITSKPSVSPDRANKNSIRHEYNTHHAPAHDTNRTNHFLLSLKGRKAKATKRNKDSHQDSEDDGIHRGHKIDTSHAGKDCIQHTRTKRQNSSQESQAKKNYIPDHKAPPYISFKFSCDPLWDRRYRQSYIGI